MARIKIDDINAEQTLNKEDLSGIVGGKWWDRVKSWNREASTTFFTHVVSGLHRFGKWSASW
ncbi:MAG: hypothetical protein HY957_06455 [Nitrospirae bacterium]|nr:hypothetical protein [Nitrospirota bacterium]